MHERCLPHKLAISHYVSSKFNGHVTPITGRLPGVNVLVSCRHELSASSPAPPIFRHITGVNHDWLLKPGVTRAGRGRGALAQWPLSGCGGLRPDSEPLALRQGLSQ